MSALGQFLVKERWINADELSEALLEQQRLGGRLGTTLLEKGFLSENLLLRALGDQQGVPTAGAEDLRQIPPEVLAAIPAELASRHLAIPFRAFGGRVDVAMAGVDDLSAIDQLAFAVGKSLRPHIAIEARLYHALEVHYGVRCPQRFRVLIQALDRARGRAVRSESPVVPHSEPAAHAPASRSDHRTRRFVPRLQAPSQRSIPLSEEERRALENDEPAPSGGPADAGSLSPEGHPAVALATATSGPEIGRLLLAGCSEHFVRTVIFRVRRQEVGGWMASGPDLNREWLQDYSVGLRQPTVFRDVDRHGTYRGRLAPGPNHEALARCWGGGLDHECLVVPIRVRGQMVGALYGDRGAIGLESAELGVAENLAIRAGLAFERLILDRKLRS